MYERTALPDGLRVISARVPGARSFSIAAFVLAGTRHERPEDAGIAHFMEHLTFKGTAAYPTTRAVSEAIEGVGGGCNAATDRESTVYWARVPVAETDRAVGVLGELIARPRLDPTEVEREKGVIVEEIRSYVDDPSEYAGILFDRAMFGDGPLGREIAGDEGSVRGLTPAAIEAFWRARYRPDAIVVSAVGDVAHDDVVARVAAAFAPAAPPSAAAPQPEAPEPAPPLPAGERVLVDRRETTQVQLSLGVPALRRDHPDQWTLEVLNGILGEGMSSRLFLTVREERGLAYDVDSYIVDYADAGALVIRAGVDPRNVRRAVRAILGELVRLRDEDVSADELRKATGYLCGRLELRLEETRHLASWLGAQEALHERVHTLEEAVEEIRAVGPAAIRRLAGALFHDDALRLALVAPKGSARDIGSALMLDGGQR
ncbi:MAG: insulinase family protein [Chloroflexi bacterium]|jgi:predicted Zn-dependent peptidase|nr:insulinase family protein [Chloroflexota bacterium]